MCFEHLSKTNIGIKKNNILCIGDSLETDILGANKFGLESLFIVNGIHKNQLNSNGSIISEIYLKNFLKRKK